jgi:murein DD-endopeptidase MepM/ murein hydrolase activator NlpD
MNLFVKLIILLPVLFFTNVSNSEVRNIFIEKNKIITLSVNFIQGGLIKGKAFPHANIKFLDKNIFLDEKNRFVFGFGRDFENKAIISITYKKKLITKSLSIEKQNYKIQRIEGLPKRMVTPPESVYKRIISENKEIAKVRKLNSNVSFIFQNFVWPLKGIITGVFGSQRVLNGKPKRPHYGIDIAAKEGTEIIAPLDSIVRMAEKDLYYTGGTIMLDHGHGVTSVYSHLSKILVKVNENIKKGDIIGLVGSTGRSTGPHLDWRINWFEQRLDPSLLIKK